MEQPQALQEVLSSGEAEKIWGLSQGTVKVYCRRGVFTEREARKSENVWLITRSGMKRVFGRTEAHREQLKRVGFKMVFYKQLSYEEQCAIDAVNMYINSLKELERESGEPAPVTREGLEEYIREIIEQGVPAFSEDKKKTKTTYTLTIQGEVVTVSICYRNNKYQSYEVEGVDFNA